MFTVEYKPSQAETMVMKWYIMYSIQYNIKHIFFLLEFKIKKAMPFYFFFFF